MTPSAAFFPPFFFLLFSMLALTPIHRFNAAALSQDQDQDNDATWLLSFKASVYSDPSNLLGSWNTSPNPCSNSSSSSSWFGVSCDPISSRVVSLNLTIPSQGRQPNGFNILSGTLSSSLAHLTHLRILSLAHHAFSGRIPPQLGSLNSLQILELQGCNLSGSIPHSLFLSLSLHFLNLSHNSLSDSIPPGFLNSTGALAVLDLSNNLLSGALSSSKSSSNGCPQSLAYLSLSNNFLVGNIPANIGTCSNLTTLLLNGNLFEGKIPSTLGRLSRLQVLDISRNNLSRNKLSGYLPERLGELEGLQHVLLAENNLTGEIPNQIGELTSLLALNLSHNDLRGYIPTNLGNAKNLEIVLLDHNSISGEVPSSLAALSNLALLDLSFNNLSGPIPPFKHAINCDSFKGNPFLHSCPDHGVSAPPTGLPFPLKVRKGQNRSKLRSFVIGISTSVSVLVSILTVIFVFILGRRKLSRLASLRRKVVVTFTGAPPGLNYDNVIRATGNFSVGNLIGSGGFGSTYKAELVPGFLVAVKRLSIGRFQGIQQFDAEIRTLGRIRHKNLVTLMGYYVGKAEMFLVYNYLPGGNLDTFIHEETCMNKEWRVIHKIAVDVANALTYLHYSCVPRIVHRDIKPSNILLDEELNAYLSDFGLARLLEVFQTHATTDVAGTFGYVAPEYATTCRVSDKADVYSFGVVLLELLSGKKSLDPSFSEYGNGFNIVAWARLLVAEGRSFELFSPELWQSGPHDDLLAMLRLASSCTVESVSVRPSTKQVLDKLNQLNA
ncbi:unnamed protein product [Coffea canephora]|uniref:non-specific serine/threonine protein kinase n=1 Tax=Coffea canephora TaxID=49390 RepID=A0A068U7E5_COFCA|nr:unnamed protein product [Coffea canephora]